MKTIVWDFDGTLGFRKGKWAETLLEVIRNNAPETRVRAEDIRPYAKFGFPWHTPEQPHTQTRTAGQWWQAMNSHFVKAFMAMGFTSAMANKMALQVRDEYTLCDNWFLYPDTLPTLKNLTLQGWNHVILSNHVPELEQIVWKLDIRPFFSDIFNSAKTGFEKPNPQAFALVIKKLPHTTELWMVGDSVGADVRGAEALGIPAILVRKKDPAVKYSCTSLSRIENIISQRFAE